MQQRFLGRRSVLGLLAAAPAALALSARPARAATTVRIGVQPVESAGQTFYGKDLGWFEQAGLDVQISPMSNGPALVAAVISGALDIGLSAVGSVAQAHVKGLGVKIIAPAGMSLSTAPTDVTMVAIDSPIKTAADLSGKTIAVNGIGNVLMYATQAWIDKNGGDSKKVKWVEMPFPSMAGAIAAKRVDGATLAEPYVSDAKSVARALANPMDAIALTIQALRRVGKHASQRVGRDSLEIHEHQAGDACRHDAFRVRNGRRAEPNSSTDRCRRALRRYRPAAQRKRHHLESTESIAL
jgi:NitT/TauT family transport system substrate-binding protein